MGITELKENKAFSMIVQLAAIRAELDFFEGMEECMPEWDTHSGIPPVSVYFAEIDGEIEDLVIDIHQRPADESTNGSGTWISLTVNTAAVSRLELTPEEIVQHLGNVVFSHRQLETCPEQRPHEYDMLGMSLGYANDEEVILRSRKEVCA